MSGPLGIGDGSSSFTLTGPSAGRNSASANAQNRIASSWIRLLWTTETLPPSSSRAGALYSIPSMSTAFSAIVSQSVRLSRSAWMPSSTSAAMTRSSSSLKFSARLAPNSPAICGPWGGSGSTARRAALIRSPAPPDSRRRPQRATRRRPAHRWPAPSATSSGAYAACGAASNPSGNRRCSAGRSRWGQVTARRHLVLTRSPVHRLRSWDRRDHFRRLVRPAR